MENKIAKPFQPQTALHTINHYTGFYQHLYLPNAVQFLIWPEKTFLTCNKRQQQLQPAKENMENVHDK